MTSRDSSRTTSTGPTERLVFVCLAGVAAALAGCSGGSEPSGPSAGTLVAGYNTTENAPWLDFDAAVSSALLGSQLAVVERRIITPTERRWILISAQDEPGSLRITVPELWAEPWDTRVVYECRIGHFGAPEREAAFIEAIRAWRPKYSR